MLGMIATLKVMAGLSRAGVGTGAFQFANRRLGYGQYGSQVFETNIGMTAVSMLGIVSSVLNLAMDEVIPR
jgi:hypothetical protein